MAEIEAKFLIRRAEQIHECLDAIAGLGYEIAAGETGTHVDTYFDTSDLAIYRAGWTFRCRQCNDTSTLTLKSLGSPRDALFVREEVEQPLTASCRLEKGKLPDGPVQQRLEGMVSRKRRRALFRVRSRRTIYFITPPGEQACIVELDLDDASIDAAKRKQKAPGHFSFTELELELKSGNADAVSMLARHLREYVQLVPSQFSKFQRGMLAAGLSAMKEDAESAVPKFKGSDPFPPLLQWYLKQQFNSLIRHQPVAWEGLDPEGVHQMRVAIRRIRAMLSAFSPVFDPDSCKRLDSDLRQLAWQLGDARDADVCEEQIKRFNAVLSASAVRDAGPYADHLRTTTFSAYANLNEFLASTCYSELITRLERFVADLTTNEAMRPYEGLSISRCADTYVRKAVKKMIRRGDRIASSSSSRKVHKLRIRAKRLRYLLDFFSVVQKRKWREPIMELENLQEMLGDHQDAVTARGRLQDYASSLPEEDANRGLLLAVGRLLQVEEDRIARHRQQLPAAWSRFKHSF